jgi:hypothetical protein
LLIVHGAALPHGFLFYETLIKSISLKVTGFDPHVQSSKMNASFTGCGKLIWSNLKCQGTTSVVPQAQEKNGGL